MTDTAFPQGLCELAPRYDLILCDVWGVIHNGRAAFREAGEALAKFRAGGRHVVLITNATVSDQKNSNNGKSEVKAALGKVWQFVPHKRVHMKGV